MKFKNILKTKGFKKVEKKVDSTFFSGELFNDNHSDFEFSIGERRQMLYIAGNIQSLFGEKDANIMAMKK